MDLIRRLWSVKAARRGVAALLAFSLVGWSFYSQYANPGTAEAATVVTLTNTALTTWTVPDDWNSDDNLIEVIGGGGAGDS
ncbi:MAG TPA: hypothetical protein VHO23_03245, partial [Candidatus Paceibacterota bacterium]|nr:hypothetical protein [Candidatus Paceibacterota bacterium]